MYVYMNHMWCLQERKHNSAEDCQSLKFEKHPLGVNAHVSLGVVLLKCKQC